MSRSDKWRASSGVCASTAIEPVVGSEPCACPPIRPRKVLSRPRRVISLYVKRGPDCSLTELFAVLALPKITRHLRYPFNLFQAHKEALQLFEVINFKRGHHHDGLMIRADF